LTEKRSLSRKWVVAGIGLLWSVGLFAGFAALQREEFTPVPNTLVGNDFPQGSAITPVPGRPTLLVFLHPYCPCSHATLRQLDELRLETQDQAAVTLVFTIAKDLPAGWEKESLWRTAQAMSGVRVIRDEDGVEARRFNVVGSGHALLYDSKGHLLFSGGITPSRGHEGDNPGQDAIVSFVLHGRADLTHTPVFGCSLL
jgi:hypothetical protein